MKICLKINAGFCFNSTFFSLNEAEERSARSSICIGAEPPAHTSQRHTVNSSRAPDGELYYATLHCNKLFQIKLVQKKDLSLSLSFFLMSKHEKLKKAYGGCLTSAFDHKVFPFCPHAINFFLITNCNTSLSMLNMKKRSKPYLEQRKLKGKCCNGLQEKLKPKPE